MSIVELGALGEFVGALAVVVTLAFLTVQLRQNTHSVHQASFQDAIRHTAQILNSMVSDSELTQIYFDGMRDLDSLSQPERRRFAVYATSIVRAYENLVHQTLRGSLDADAWEGIREQLAYQIVQPGWRSWFAQSENLVNRETREFLQELLDRPTPDGPPTAAI